MQSIQDLMVRVRANFTPDQVARLPRHEKMLKVYGAYGVRQTVQTEDPDASDRRIWDIARANDGWAYFETDESGAVIHRFLRKDMPHLLEQVYHHFCTLANPNIPSEATVKSREAYLGLQTTDIEWQHIATGSNHDIFELNFSDKYQLKLEYNHNDKSATVQLCKSEKDGEVVVYEDTNDSVHSILHAQQWAGVHISTLMHNIAAQCKRIEIDLTATKGWKDLAAQNL